MLRHLVNAMSQIKKINLTFEQIDLDRREEKKNVPLVYLKIEFAILNQSQVYSLKKKLKFQFETYICSQHVHLYLQ